MKYKFFLVSFVFSILILSSRYRFCHIIGNSMNPTLRDGQFCLIEVGDDITDGDIVVLDTKNEENISAPSIVKRYVEEKSTATDIYVLGDNSAHSYDSRMFGTLNRETIIGRIVLVF